MQIIRNCSMWWDRWPEASRGMLGFPRLCRGGRSTAKSASGEGEGPNERNGLIAPAPLKAERIQHGSALIQR